MSPRPSGSNCAKLHAVRTKRPLANYLASGVTFSFDFAPELSHHGPLVYV